jgi:predicted TPR repeat methyltransferase
MPRGAILQAPPKSWRRRCSLRRLSPPHGLLLGAVRDSLGDRAGAIVAWRKANDADPEDYHGARLQLARLGAGEDTPAMTAAYVRRLFDQQAASFDETLLQRLDYCGPAVLLRPFVT